MNHSDWTQAYRSAWPVFYACAFLIGIPIKAAWVLRRSQTRVRTAIRLAALSGLVLAVCDALALPAVTIALLLVSSAIWNPTVGLRPLDVLAVCVLVGLIRAVLEKRFLSYAIKESLSTRQFLSLWTANCFVLLLASAGLFWWVVWSSPSRGLGI